MKFPEAGEIFGYKYRIERVIGSGGFSRVYLATQLDLDRAVAIKILQPPINTLHGAERDERLQSLTSRFEREARMVSKLKSPNTINMYDYGRADDGQLFMVIEYVDGMTLSELIRKEGAIEPKRAAKILRQTLMGLYEAHQLGMLHRDIKPQNIMVFDHMGLSDQVKLLDFGIVKLIGSDDASKDLTSDDTLVGTPRYMSPEYIRGAPVGEASDIYSLGLVIYELLVGEQAIQAHSSIQIIGKQLERDSFYLPAELNIDLPLRLIVNAMLEKNVANRYAEISAILADLEQRSDSPSSLPKNVSAAVKSVSVPSLSLAPQELTGRLDGAVRHTIRHDAAPPGALPLVSLDTLEHGQDLPTEPEDASVPSFALTGNNHIYVAAGITLALVVIVVAIGITLTTKTDAEAANSQASQPVAAMATQAPNQGALDSLDTKTLPDDLLPAAADSQKQGGPLLPAASSDPLPPQVKPAVLTYKVSVSPPEAKLFVNGEERGTGELDLHATDFPLEIRATHDGQEQRRNIKLPNDVKLVVPPAQKTTRSLKVRKPRPELEKKPEKKPELSEPKPEKKPEDTPKQPAPSSGKTGIFGENLGPGL